MTTLFSSQQALAPDWYEAQDEDFSATKISLMLRRSRCAGPSRSMPFRKESVMAQSPTSLDHVNVVVRDVERSLVFYEACLGLKPVMDRVLEGPWFEKLTEMDGARARCVILQNPAGGCRIELLQFVGQDGAPLPANRLPATPGLRHFAVRVEAIDPIATALRARLNIAVEVVDVPPDIVRGGKRMAYVRDPDGAIVELSQYAEARPEFCG
jgi:catechol 2,3-dioxygenase-like lactoylglutathione lyase family enzyme